MATARPGLFTCGCFSTYFPATYTLATDHLRPVALGAEDPTPCSGTAVSGIQRLAGSQCRQHPVGGAREETPDGRSQFILGPTSSLKGHAQVTVSSKGYSDRRHGTGLGSLTA